MDNINYPFLIMILKLFFCPIKNYIFYCYNILQFLFLTLLFTSFSLHIDQNRRAMNYLYTKFNYNITLIGQKLIIFINFDFFFFN